MKRISRNILGTEQIKSVDRIGDCLNPDLGGLTTLSNSESLNLGDTKNRSTIFVKILNTDLPHPWEDESTQKLLSTMEKEVSAAISRNPLCKQVSFRNGEVWAAFIDDNEERTDTVYGPAIEVNSIIMFINVFAEKYGYAKLRVGVGLSYGETRLTQISKRTLTSEELWVGEGISSARKAAEDTCHGEKTEWEILADKSFFDRLSENRRNKSFTDRRSTKVLGAMMEEYKLIK